ncbi:retrovirus-related pol polyprotein LINE-1 [Tanacetum coccineum]
MGFNHYNKLIRTILNTSRSTTTAISRRRSGDLKTTSFSTISNASYHLNGGPSYMRGAVFWEPNKPLTFEDFEMPRPKVNEVLIKTKGKVSREKTEYLRCNFGRYEVVHQEVDVRIGDRILQPKESFRYLGSVIHRSGRIDEDVAHRIGVGWMKWRAASGLCRAGLDVNSIIDKMREGRLRWFGHVKRRPQNAPVRRVEAMSVEGSRRRGRPKLRCEDRLKQDMMKLLLSVDMTSDRNGWRDRIRISGFCCLLCAGMLVCSACVACRALVVSCLDCWLCLFVLFELWSAYGFHLVLRGSSCVLRLGPLSILLCSCLLFAYMPVWLAFSLGRFCVVIVLFACLVFVRYVIGCLFAFALLSFSFLELLYNAHVHWPEVPWKQSLYFRVYLGGRGRICLRSPPPYLASAGLGPTVTSNWAVCYTLNPPRLYFLGPSIPPEAVKVLGGTRTRDLR